MVEDAEYPLGMEPAEVQRLERQHSIWREATTRVWDLAGFSPGQTIIDLGSGPGFATVDLARAVGPTGRVIAIDSSSEALSECSRLAKTAGLRNVEVLSADVTRLGPSIWNADGMFARWLLSYLRDPAAVIQTVTRGLRPGGTLAVMDYWNYLSIRTEPRSALFDRVFQAVYDSVADNGGSYEVAGRLPSMFMASGLKVTEVESFSRVGGRGSPLWTWISEFQRLHLPSLVDKGYLTNEELQAYITWWEELGEGALLFAPPVLGVIGVKAD